MQLDVQTLTILGWMIPLVVGVVTKKWANAGVKAVTNLALSAVVGGIAVATEANGHVMLKTWLFNIVATFLQSIVAYYGLWKPTGAAPALQEATASFGLGSGQPEPVNGNGGRTLDYDEVRAVRQMMRARNHNTMKVQANWRNDQLTSLPGDSVIADEPDVGEVEHVEPEPRPRDPMPPEPEVEIVDDAVVPRVEFPAEFPGEAHRISDPTDKSPEALDEAEQAKARRSEAAKKAWETRRANAEAAMKVKKPAAKKATSRQ